MTPGGSRSVAVPGLRPARRGMARDQDRAAALNRQAP
jgi:hypothetical protein